MGRDVKLGKVLDLDDEARAGLLPQIQRVKGMLGLERMAGETAQVDETSPHRKANALVAVLEKSGRGNKSLGRVAIRPCPGPADRAPAGERMVPIWKARAGRSNAGVSADEVERRLPGANLLTRVITADEIAYLVVFLASSK
jgi:hypothetical protein